MARATKPRFVDTGNPALAIDCPHCGLLTPRFLQYCRNCGFSLWPSSPFASAAFQAWRDADPARRAARRYDLELPSSTGPEVIDYEARAHHLGIHLFPASSYPFVICLGMFLLALAAIPFGAPVRWTLGVVGMITFLIGVFGWVVLEDVKMYPAQDLPVTREPAEERPDSTEHGERH
ncbi:MAG: hypothetical protein DLM67_12950 [Candidatus Nephthysia bennettiae]|uniref:Uncharacterized protein n=1 Tax=Candidatus Nephthysia bennettiae TaxID=3127016 RepID=A0A934K9M9_9BACT|nr:hypothetical protein [Candidatus Dormibacteraeota bacterium]MBJ7614887.1 hypothetical protein [Candidatus Dormibacteraeota bacterium]PZR94026.1 MAG: hypothetical protein DLM67_12950 [Candidatus Dormibacteraeota bacterium]